MSIPIVDSHIHLFPATHLPSLAWHGPDNPLGSQHSVDEYRAATASIPTTTSSDSTTPSSSTYYLRGFIFLETDRISSLDESSATGGWTNPLDEVSFLARVALGEPLPGEGHTASDRALCLGIVPWAPVPAGPEALQRYMALVREQTRTEDVWRKVRGARYLLQDKPAGTMLGKGFVEGVRWLGREGLVFDLGVDARQGGLWQLREAVEMMRRVYDGVKEEERVVFVISMSSCLPLHIYNMSAFLLTAGQTTSANQTSASPSRRRNRSPRIPTSRNGRPSSLPWPPTK